MVIATEVNAYWEVFGRVHPLLVHFPLALILLAAVVECFWYAAGKREHPARTASTCMWFGLVAGGLAVWAGWLLADYQDEAGELVQLHRWTGVAAIGVLALAAAAWVLRVWRGRAWTAPHVSLLLVSAVLVTVSGHFGGEMAWGAGWVLAPLEQPEGGPRGSWTSVEPILVDHCEKCHGPKRQKGDVQVVPWSSLFQGEAADWAIVPGDAAASRLHTLIALPIGDDDIMPPAKQRNPLSDAQIQAIVDWIDAGAPGPDGQVPTASQPAEQS